jgi:hypothetical protein
LSALLVCDLGLLTPGISVARGRMGDGDELIQAGD